MWKETEFYSKRDDDSAIGDSENNSAGEESTNSRRKSSTSDDIDDLQMDSHEQLNSKVGTKIPDCLLKNTDERLENCLKFRRNSQNNQQPKSKRIIRVLPASAVLQKKPSESTKPTAKNQPHMEVLEAKLHYLFFEMRKLRELDRDILRKFIGINDSVDEMRWKIAESEADMKRDMAEDDVDDEIITKLTDSRLKEWEELDEAEDDEDMKFVVPVTKATTSYASLTYVKSRKSSNASLSDSKRAPSPTSQRKNSRQHNYVTLQNDGPHSYANPTYGHVDAHGRLTQVAQSERTSAREQQSDSSHQTSYYNRYKSPRPTSAISDASSMKKSRVQQDPPPAQLGINRTQRPKSASSIVRKYSDRIQQQQNARTNPNSGFRMVADENSRIGRSSQWNSTGGKVEKKVPDFQTQREYQNLIGLSRVRAGDNATNPQPVRQKSFTKPSGSAGSIASSSSLTSSSSSSSFNSPTRNGSSRSNKWGRLGLGKSAKSANTQESHNRKAPVVVNNNYKATVIVSHRPVDVIPRNDNVITMSYKRSPSDSVYNWIQSQDDVTYL